MIQANILEQFIVLYKVLINNKNLLNIIIVALVSLLFLILANTFKNKKITKTIYIFIYLGIFSYLIYSYYNEILNLLDYLIDNIVLLLFFPNLAVYILVLVLINLLVVKSSFAIKEKKLNKILNTIFFIFFNIIFYLIVNIIIDNNINVYEQLSIYTNNNLLNLIGLSMKLFLIWIGLLILIKIIDKINIYTLNRKQINNNLVLELPSNSKELQILDTKEMKTNTNEILEINPIIEVKKEYNVYNDYIDIEPIKKYKDNLVNVFNSSNIDLKDKSIYKEDISIELENNLNDLTISKQIPTLDELLTNTKSKYQSIKTKTFVENNNAKKIEIDLGSYDYIFEKIPLKNNYEKDMNNVFGINNNYLQSIIFDIEKLKNNQTDKNKIKEVYDKIKINEDNLSLNDYNYLINRLLEIKK